MKVRMTNTNGDNYEYEIADLEPGVACCPNIFGSSPAIELNKVYNENCLETMSRMQDRSIQCILTSPPYWSLRNYANQDSEQLGQENTPQEYIDKLVEIFMECHRVLRKDGVMFLNIGDTYFNTQNSNRNGVTGTLGGETRGGGEYKTQKKSAGDLLIKRKDLCGIPWRLAFALQDRGWYIRQDIIWAKKNPMPGSMKDRCTSSHEYIFLLTKSENYYWDAEAIKEDGVYPAGTKAAKGSEDRFALDGVNSRPPEYKIYDGRRNKRDVWFMATQPFKGGHFAAYPQQLAETCILASTSEKGCCSICKKPIERSVEKTRLNRTQLDKNDPRYRPNQYTGEYAEINGKGDAGYTLSETIGWELQCDCKADVEPCLVYDCFGGAGTSFVVSQKLGRNWIGSEISSDYCKIIEERLK